MTRGIIPALAHTMLQSDALAGEFNEILNLVEIYAPFQPLDPAITFYAPLRNTVRDLRLNLDSFERASDAWYKDGSGIYRKVGINRARFEKSQLLMEPAQTNKCTNFNFAPDPSKTNMSGSGVADLVREFNPQWIADLGLQDLAPDGYIWRYDNNSGSTQELNTFGATGNQNTHVSSAFVERINGFGVEIGFTGGAGTWTTIPSSLPGQYEHIGTPNTTVARWGLRIANGASVRFIGNQLEETPVRTNPIVTEGTAGQRAVDVLNYLAPEDYINHSQGMTLINWVPLYSFGDTIADTRRDLLGLPNRWLYEERSGADVPYIRARDAGNIIPNVTVEGGAGWLAGSEYLLAMRWAPGDIQVGLRQSNGWVWGAPLVYTGTMDITGNLLLITQGFPQRFSDLQIYNEDKGTDWIEANYP